MMNVLRKSRIRIMRLFRRVRRSLFPAWSLRVAEKNNQWFRELLESCPSGGSSTLEVLALTETEHRTTADDRPYQWSWTYNVHPNEAQGDLFGLHNPPRPADDTYWRHPQFGWIYRKVIDA